VLRSVAGLLALKLLGHATGACSFGKPALPGL
jgi:hypothetical protein